MAFSILYKSLCEVQLLHEYFLGTDQVEFGARPAGEQAAALRAYQLPEQLQIVPTEETERVMKGLAIRLRHTNTGFVLGMQVRQAGNDFQPARNVSDGFTLRFYALLRNPHFLNFTNTPLDRSMEWVNWFSNAATASHMAYPYLAAPATKFKAGTRYRAGEVVRKTTGAGQLYVALKDGTHSAPVPSSSVWKQLTQQGYATSEDLVRVLLPRHVVRFPNGVAEAPSYKVVGPGGVVAQGLVDVSTGTEPSDAVLDVSKIRAGRYLLQVDGTDGSGTEFSSEEAVFLGAPAVTSALFAIVELGYKPGETTSDYSLFDETAGYRLRQPQFVLRLLNRSTYWRYHFRTPLEPSVDLEDLEHLGDDYVTRRPHALTTVYTPVTYDDGKLLPNPGVAIIKPSGDRVFSDVFVHQ